MAEDIGRPLTVRQTAPKILDAARKALGKIDGLVINHGVLTPLARLADADVEEWHLIYSAANTSSWLNK